MRTIIGWLAAFVFGSAGWWLGAHLGVLAAVIASSIAGGAGLYYGFRWFDRNLA